MHGFNKHRIFLKSIIIFTQTFRVTIYNNNGVIEINISGLKSVKGPNILVLSVLSYLGIQKYQIVTRDKNSFCITQQGRIISHLPLRFSLNPNTRELYQFLYHFLSFSQWCIAQCHLETSCTRYFGIFCQKPAAVSGCTSQKDQMK